MKRWQNSTPALLQHNPKKDYLMMNIKQTRKALGLTLQAAGERVGITREGVRLAEAGKAPDAAAKLAKHYRAASAKDITSALKLTAEKAVRLTLDIRFDKVGDLVVSYEGVNTDSEMLGDFIVKALAAAEGKTTKLF